MSRKDDTAPHQQPEKKHPEKEPHVSMTLQLCDWKNEFTERQYKVLIAEALNYCVYKEGMKIAGYLITKRRLCLVLISGPSHVNELLQIFYKRLRKEIQHAHHRKNIPAEALEKTEAIAAEKHPQLFIRYPLQNYMLIRLITGQSVNLPYYSPHLARLKDRIAHCDFCSAMDYTGAEGPVVVKLPDKAE
jgi:hypothetical protein